MFHVLISDSFSRFIFLTLSLERLSPFGVKITLKKYHNTCTHYRSPKVFVVPPSKLMQRSVRVMRCSILGYVLLIYSKRLFWT